MAWLAELFTDPKQREQVLGYTQAFSSFGGLLVASAVAIPIVDQVFDVSTWLFDSPIVHLAGGVLVVGIVQEGLKYLTIRLSVYGSREFDERTDGIIYGTAVGLGFATWFVGLVVTVPVIGHATWHAYRELVGPAPVSSAST